MKQLTIISGKGGTGKTTLTAAFAHLATNLVIADCDVDAADLHLILTPTVIKQEPFYGGKLPLIDRNLCVQCGICEEKCRFGAIRSLEVDSTSCEGCGVCAYICPEKAITMKERLSGHWFISETREGPLVHARLGIAEENSGKLVSTVRQEAKDLAEKESCDLILIDGPPGIGCPVIASITGADLVLAVTEPTLSGIHDLQRILEVAHHFNIPSAVCINKFTINLDNTLKIEEYCDEQEIEVVGRIPFDPSVTQAMIRALSVVEYPCGKVSEEVGKIWARIEEKLQ
ncbi:MAG TPA: ATP-binding protein [Thermodesulfobacteriota bacterium]|nr:ATP-binding protein [Thermodesulfobacteriota bacterium]